MTSMARACRGSSPPRTPSPNAVTNVVHDHTSVLATIEAKWNLPPLTYRDANAQDGQGLPRPEAAAADARTAASDRTARPRRSGSGRVRCAGARDRRLVLVPGAGWRVLPHRGAPRRHVAAGGDVAGVGSQAARTSLQAPAGPPRVRHHARERGLREHLRGTRRPTPTSPRPSRPRGRCSRTTTAPATRATTTTYRSSPDSRPTPTTRPTARTSANSRSCSSTPKGSRTAIGCVYPEEVQNIGTQLTANKLKWKAYMQDMGNDPNREAAACGHPGLGDQRRNPGSRRRRRLRHPP